MSPSIQMAFGIRLRQGQGLRDRRLARQRRADFLSHFRAHGLELWNPLTVMSAPG